MRLNVTSVLCAELYNIVTTEELWVLTCKN